MTVPFVIYSIWLAFSVVLGLRYIFLRDFEKVSVCVIAVGFSFIGLASQLWWSVIKVGLPGLP